MQRTAVLSLLLVVVVNCFANGALAQAAAATPEGPATEPEAPAPAPEPSPFNVTATPAQRNATFVAANITSPDALVSRVIAGPVPNVNNSNQLTCEIHLLGQGLNSPVDVTSLDPSTQATGLANASIACTGSTANATIQGGQALSAFTSNISGRPT